MAQRMRVGPVRRGVRAARFAPRVFHLVKFTGGRIAKVACNGFRSYPLAAPDASKLV